MHPGMPARSAVRGAMGVNLTSNAEEVRGSMEYRKYEQMGEEIRDVLLQVRQEARDTVMEANTPKAAVICPCCGASTMPNATGICEYCGGALNA